MVKCEPCNIAFVSEPLLKAHYRTSDVHPSCSRCPEGFKDQVSLSAVSFAECVKIVFSQLGPQHTSAVHLVRCEPCDRVLYREDLQAHYKSSPSHPTCIACGEGFLNDALHKQASFHVIPAATARYLYLVMPFSTRPRRIPKRDVYLVNDCLRPWRRCSSITRTRLRIPTARYVSLVSKTTLLTCRYASTQLVEDQKWLTANCST